MDFGKNIKKIRKEKKITQVALAKLLNKSESSIQKYESGAVVPDFIVLNEIADALGCTLMDLVGSTEQNSNEDNNTLDTLSQYFFTLGYDLIADPEEGYLILKSKEGEYEITESDIEELKSSIQSFSQFKLHELTKKSRKIGK